MIYDELVHNAKTKFKMIKPEIDRLGALGISKKSDMGNKSSHIVVTYPPIHKLGIEKEIFFEKIKNNTLYVHIPFCTGICTYCNYARTAIPGNDKVIEEYLVLLDKESSILRDFFGGRKIPLESVYIGGGTPTLFKESYLGKLFKIIKRDFKINKEIEYTLEGSPETITFDKIMLAKKYGVNRISIGIESFNDSILTMVSRRHDAKEALMTIDKIRAAGIENIDFDLIRGFPGYTEKMMLADVAGVEKSEVPSVNSNHYTIKPGSIDEKMFKNIYLDQNKQILLHLIFLEGMKQLGYNQRPIDWFIKKRQHEYKHQILKWENMANQLVLGPSSYGYINGFQFVNFRNFKDYRASIESQQLPIERSTKLSDKEIMRRRFIFGLKTRIDRDEFQNMHGIDPVEGPFKETLSAFVKAGGIEADKEEIRLTEAGSLFADWIQMAFYSTHNS